MKGTVDRRIKILERLCERRRDCVKALASDFHVSYRTIETDIEILSCSFPIFTVQGPDGGVFVMDGYHLGMKYLTDDQSRLLERLSTSLTGEDLFLIREIIKTFRRPVLQK